MLRHLSSLCEAGHRRLGLSRCYLTEWTEKGLGLPLFQLNRGIEFVWSPNLHLWVHLKEI
jgi:hypothetical protein